MLKNGCDVKKVIICCGRTDLRKGIPGLSAIIRLNHELDPSEKGTLYLFCGSRRSIIKGLVHEGDGFCLIVKKLTDGSFQWPRNSDEARQLSREEFDRLMDGFTIESSIKTRQR